MSEIEGSCLEESEREIRFGGIEIKMETKAHNILWENKDVKKIIEKHKLDTAKKNDSHREKVKKSCPCLKTSVV